MANRNGTYIIRRKRAARGISALLVFVVCVCAGMLLAAAPAAAAGTNGGACPVAAMGTNMTAVPAEVRGTNVTTAPANAATIPAATAVSAPASLLQELCGAEHAPLPMQMTVTPTVTAEYNNKAVITWAQIPGVSGYEVCRGGRKIAEVAAGEAGREVAAGEADEASTAGESDRAVKAEEADGAVTAGKAAKGNASLCTYKERGLKAGTRYTYQVIAFYDMGGVRVRGITGGRTSVRAICREPRLLLVATEGSRVVMPEVFGEIGCEVTQVYRPADVDVDRYDALLVPGGGDVDPVFWGGQKHPAASELDPEKDRFQIEAIQAFAKAGKPILGVCRGEQLINVAFGGSMIQNLYPNSREPVYEEGFHRVRTAKGSWVRKVYGETPRVFFHHHQAVDRLGEGIIATAWSTDHPYPHIEAIQHERLPIYGVQWHPDAEVESQGIEIYRAFRQVCLDNMAQ